MKRFSLAILALVVATGAQAASEKVEMNLVTSQGGGQSKPAPRNPQAGLLIHKIPVNMKGQKVPGI